ncbi:MAG: hypothetical protein HY914_03395 [Desulfomonile tiedjei]|nr:hypothetical protein [Desulfomonile tiedjei]
MRTWDWITIQRVWNRGCVLRGQAPELWRQDGFGNLIYRPAYGYWWSSHGWDVDLEVSESLGGDHELSDLRPVQCAEKRRQAGASENPTEAPESRQAHPFFSTPWGYRR